jgi:hypothetical protein
MTVSTTYYTWNYVNLPLFLMRQKNLSCPTCKLRFKTLATKLFHSTNLIPTKALLKETFRGTKSGVFATVAYVHGKLYYTNLNTVL